MCMVRVTWPIFYFWFPIISFEWMMLRTSNFYRAMQNSAKRSLEIACRLSICLSVCLSVTLMDHDHRLQILETNCANIFAFHSPKVIHLLPGEHGEILGRKCSFNTYIHNVHLNWVGTVALGTVYGIWHSSSLFTASLFMFERFIKCSFSSQRWLLSTRVSQLSIII